MLEITPDDISLLNDADLRTLVGMLCEAEMRGRDLPVSHVTWGGDQNAKDGGVDVRVGEVAPDWEGGFIPRACTGFQVKRQDMPPGAIEAEMRPKGALRDVIQELSRSRGAYIIVSSRGTTSDSGLKARRGAMSSAASDAQGDLYVDFYDRTRIATWVRGHPGLIIWVRRAIGRSLSGWQPYGAWAHASAGIEADYLLDGAVRVRERTAANANEFSAGEALTRIRGILSDARSAVRIVGLSGVGKTRFVQALFDARIEGNALDPAVMIYTDMGDEPDPPPHKLAADLLANRSRAVMVVDNCPPELHARLSSLVNSQGSRLSVVTVEYDIRDDLPESTDVFEIRAASAELIEALLRQRFPQMSGTDIHTAAEFSCGNARIALALARTVKLTGSLTGLSDAQLFERLFLQRRPHDQHLLEVAQAFSLVYSFNGEDLSDAADAELHRLAALAGVNVERSHRLLAELLRRELAQRRGRWRAVLPHAMANQLAASALQDLPLARIEDALVNGAPERLAISFARRLGYLDKSAEAQSIVAKWLAPNGWIGEHIWNLSVFGQSVFRNSLPAAPEAALNALETNKIAAKENAGFSLDSTRYVAQTLRSLAWEAQYFERCTRLLQFQAVDGGLNEAADIHTALFPIQLSGTHASIEQRVSVVRGLLASGDGGRRSLGLKALAALLQAHFFSSSQDFRFGSRSRDFGYFPRTGLEVRQWYVLALSVAADFSTASSPVEHEVRDLIAGNFRSLWTNVRLHDELESLAARMVARGFWGKGWRAVKLTRFYDEKDRRSENYRRLSVLEEALRPRGLQQRIRAKVFDNSMYDLDEVDAATTGDFQLAIGRQNAEVERLAAEALAAPHELETLMPELFVASANLWHFGIGLARSATDPKALWNCMIATAAKIPGGEPDLRVLAGFLFQLANVSSPLLEALLDEALENNVLASRFPHLLPPIATFPGGLKRLRKSLDRGQVPVARYQDVFFGHAVRMLPHQDIADFILAVSRVKGGIPVAIEILGRQFFNDEHDKRANAEALVEAGRLVLGAINFAEIDDSFAGDFQLQQVVNACMAGEAGAAAALSVCRNMRGARLGHKLWIDCNELLRALAHLQPRALLDALATGDSDEVVAGADLLTRPAFNGAHPLEGVADELFIAWCSEGGRERYRFIAAVAPLVDASRGQFRPLAAALVHDSQDPLGVLAEIFARMRPTIWGGSRSAILRENAKLFAGLDTRGDASLFAYIESKQRELLDEAIDDEAYETGRDRERDERFE